MCLRSLAKYFTVSFFVLVLTACGSSSSNQDGTSPETQNTISILGSDGPMAVMCRSVSVTESERIRIDLGRFGSI